MRYEKIESDNYFYRCKNILLSPHNQLRRYGGESLLQIGEADTRHEQKLPAGVLLHVED